MPLTLIHTISAAYSFPIVRTSPRWQHDTLSPGTMLLLAGGTRERGHLAGHIDECCAHIDWLPRAIPATATRHILTKLAADRAIYQLRNQGAARRLLSKGSRQLATDRVPGALPCGHSLLSIVIIVVVILLLVLLALVIFLILKVMGLSYFRVTISVNCCQLGIKDSNTGCPETSGLAAANANSLLRLCG